MKAIRFSRMAGWGIVLACGLVTGAPHPLQIRIQPSGATVQIIWPRDVGVRVAGVEFSQFEVQQSRDLLNWTPIGTVPASQPGAEYRLESALPETPTFYRVVGSVQIQAAAPAGEQVFGYQVEFRDTLAAIGQITSEQFATRFGLTNEYLEQISFDPTTAQYWTNFNAPPVVVGPWPPLTIDFRLDTNELVLLRRSGFVVSERLGSHSFADLYYRVFYRDLPVLVTSDSILQAWHRSYAALLGEFEELYLLPQVVEIVTAMHDLVPGVWAQHQDGPLRESLLDADYFLTVARSLLTASTVASKLGQQALVETTISAVNRGQLESFVLFDRRHGAAPHQFDFSQFTVRGYYTRTPELRRYFRGMMWLGRADLRAAGNPDDPSPRELGTAIVLNRLLREAGQLAAWERADEIIRVFVGTPDSMGFHEMHALLLTAGIESLADLSTTRLEELQESILTGRLGMQAIQGDALYSPFGPGQLVLPRSFTVLGQRFITDSWALSQVVYDRVLWDANGTPEFSDKVQRRMPSGLDVAFSVLGNDATVPELFQRMTNPAGWPFRDGLLYQHNLAAVRLVVDRQAPESWDASLYAMWLAALRELSAPTTDPRFPEAMRTRAWADKTLTTQLASWTHLRHNAVLYAKESYTAGTICSYPYGFVEPQVSFWQRMASMAQRGAALLQSLPYSGTAIIPQPGTNWDGQPFPPLVLPMSQIQTQHVRFLANFAGTMSVLADIAARELAQEPLTTNQEAFLQSLVQQTWDYFAFRSFSGWYPSLFYVPYRRDAVVPALHRSDEWDALVTSVHTDVPDPIAGDPGGVLHEGVGNVNLLMMAVDSGPDRMIFAGPVLSYYEFATAGVTRLTDEQWKSQVLTNRPPTPEWTSSFIVRGQITVPDYAR